MRDLQSIMEGEANIPTISPSTFDETDYQVWVVRMETYLKALDLWEAMEEDYEVPALPTNPTMA